VSKSERETEVDKEQAEAVSSQGSERVLGNTQNEKSPGKIKPAANHSYNLRSRVHTK